jgi:hypothetical protein
VPLRTRPEGVYEGNRTATVLPARGIVHSHATAKYLARLMTAQQLDGYLYNIPVAAFPNYVVIAARCWAMVLIWCWAPTTHTIRGSRPVGRRGRLDAVGHRA